MNILKEEIQRLRIKMIIPVVDIKDNECVSGKSGKRNSYKKLNSIFGDNPLEIASNLKNAGYDLLYVADLDRIESVGDNSELISRINSQIPVLLDNAIRCVGDIKNNKDISSYNILATESMTNLDDIYDIVDTCPNDKLILSVDIKDDELLIENQDITIEDIISLINNSSFKYVILLNISRVGTKLCDKSAIEDYILEKCHDAEFILAGGITQEAIRDYRKYDIHNFLVGTILHEGKL